MEIEFDMTLDDIVALNVLHQARSPAIRRLRFILISGCLVAGPMFYAMLLIPLSYAGMLTYEAIAALVVFSVIHVLVASVYLFLIAWGMPIFFWAGFTRRLLSEGDTGSMTGRQRISITPTMISISSPSGDASWKMTVVQKILLTNQHAFIYVSPVTAFVVPRRAFFRGEEFDKFVRTVEEYSRQTAVP